MKKITFAAAIESAIAQAMTVDPTVIIIGEDVHLLRVNLLARFGEKRVIAAPISESAFLGAGVTAAMSGLKPIVEIMLIGFLGVAMDGLMNHAAKTAFFSNGQWTVPMVIRASCGGGYGDGGQHEQSLWGWLGHIPGISVVVPSNPADAGGLMLAAIQHDGPVVFLEHKLLADYWLDYLGTGGRENLNYHVPRDGEIGEVPDQWKALPLGQAEIKQSGTDISVVSVGVGVHRSLEAAQKLNTRGISAEIIDLRTVVPLDTKTVLNSINKTGHLLVVDEDYKHFGLSGEIAAIGLENDITFKFGRVCQVNSIPFSHTLEIQSIPNAITIENAVLRLLNDSKVSK